MLNLFLENRSLKVLIIINSVFILAANAFPPIFALYVDEIGGGIFEAGSIWAIFAVFTGILMIIISRFGDKIKEKEYLVAGGYLFRLLGWLGYFFSSALWHLYLLQMILAIGEALGTPAFNAIYSEHLDKGKYVRQWGVCNALSLSITGIAAFIGGAIASIFGFKILFLFMSFLALLSFIFLMIQPRKLL